MASSDPTTVLSPAHQRLPVALVHLTGPRRVGPTIEAPFSPFSKTTLGSDQVLLVVSDRPGSASLSGMSVYIAQITGLLSEVVTLL